MPLYPCCLRAAQRPERPGTFGSAAAAPAVASWFPTLAIASNGISLLSPAHDAARAAGGAARHTVLSAAGASGIGILEPGRGSDGARRARPGIMPLRSARDLGRGTETRARLKAQVLYAMPLRRTLVVGTESGSVLLCT